MTDQRQELRRRVAEAIWNTMKGDPLSEADAAITVCAKAFAEVALHGLFIQSRDTEWDEGVNATKRFIHDAILAYTNDSPINGKGEG